MIEGYDYISRVMAPGIVEFYVPTPQGHRVVRIILGGPDVRIQAFNETGKTRAPALLYLEEVLLLIETARRLLDPNYSPSQVKKDSSNEDRNS
ncbi:MAG: hypothetical protein ACXAEN_25210 [Candidatus Thorarchaeota archaeon]|jgi:hypothetical protein